MPFPVENIRKACAKRNTTLKQLEKDLGIGNGVVAKWEKAKGYPPYDRIVAIAEHLAVPVSELTGETQKESPLPDGSGRSAKEIALEKVEEIAAAGDEKALWEIFERLSQKMQKK